MDISQYVTLISTAYDPAKTDSGIRKRLDEFQLSAESWTVCSEILQHMSIEAYPVHVNFAALTMKRKVKKDLPTLAVGNREALKQMLIDSLVKYSDQSKIYSQLSVALVYLVLQNQDWKDPIMPIVTQFPEFERKTLMVMEYFGVLAEELNSLRGVKIGRNRREHLRKQLEFVAPQVHQFLVEHVDSARDDLKKSLISCCTAWCDSSLFSEAVLLESPIIPVLYSLLFQDSCDDSLHNLCTECLCTIIQTAGMNVGAYRNLLVSLNSDIVTQFTSNIGKLMTSDGDDADHLDPEDMPEKVINVIKVFVELGFALVNVYRLGIPDEQLNDIRILKVMQQYSYCKNYEVADMLISFWTELVEMLDERRPADSSRYMDILETLLPIMIRHVELPAKLTGLPNVSDSDQHKLRRSIQELMRPLVSILGIDVCMDKLCQGVSTDPAKWNTSEASICLMYACGLCSSENVKSSTSGSRNANQNADELIRHVLEGFVLSSSQSKHVALMVSCVELVGTLADWFSVAPGTALLGPSMEFLFRLLSEGGPLQSSCSKTILAVCYANASIMLDSLPIFLQAAESAVRSDPGTVSQTTYTCLFKSCGILLATLNNQKPAGPIQLDLNSLFDALREDLQNAFVHEKNVQNRQATRLLVCRLDRLCVLFRMLFQISKKENDKTIQIMLLSCLQTHLWGLLVSCMKHYDHEVVEATCNTLRYVVRCSGAAIEQSLDALVDSIIQAYKTSKRSCMLYLSSVLIDELAVGSVLSDSINRLVNNSSESLISQTLVLLTADGSVQGVREAVQNNPDVADDFFRLCKRLLQHKPELFLQFMYAKATVDLAIENSTFEHPEALPSILDFIAEILELEYHKLHAPNLCDMQALTKLVKNVIMATAHDNLNGNTIRRFSEVLFGVRSVLADDHFNAIIDNAMSDLAKQEQCCDVTTAQMTGEQLHDLVQKIKVASKVTDFNRCLFNLSELYG